MTEYQGLLATLNVIQLVAIAFLVRAIVMTHIEIKAISKELTDIGDPSTLVPNTTYQYCVTAVTATGETTPSQIAAVPLGFGQNVTSIELTWTQPNPASVSYWRLWRRSDAGAFSAAIIPMPALVDQTFADVGLLKMSVTDNGGILYIAATLPTVNTAATGKRPQPGSRLVSRYGNGNFLLLSIPIALT